MKDKPNKSATDSFWNKKAQHLRLDWAGSLPARRRFLRRVAVIMLACVVLPLIGFALWQFWPTVATVSTGLKPDRVSAPRDAPDIVISGNSGIPYDFLKARVELLAEGSLQQIHAYRLKADLESIGQIRRVEVTKDFPDTLVVRVFERQPVLMLATLDGHGEIEFWGVDDMGVVFSPYDIDRLKVLELPFIEGVHLEEIRDGQTVIDGVERIHLLLQLLKRELYPVYQDIESVSLESYGEGVAELGSIIILKGKNLKRMIFGVENFEYQVVKLMGVLSVAGRIRLDAKREIDLSLSGDAIVR